MGIIILFIVSALIFFGIAHRALDRMKLSDKGALVIIAGLVIGSFINIPVWGGQLPISVNIGGALIPLGLAIYLIATAGTGKEKIRSVAGAAVTVLVVYGIGSLLMRGLAEPAGRYAFLDTLWLFPLLAGITGYLAGRSRRGAFVSATLGMMSLDIGYYIWLIRSGAPAGRVSIGGAGAFDGIVIAGIFAILLAEAIGEIRERMAGGPTSEGKPKSLAQALRKPALNRDSGDDQKDRDDLNNGGMPNE